jgi:hypothetical protein
MQSHELKITMEIRATPASVADAGKVRLGGESPSFGPVRAAPAITADNGKVRLGGESPLKLRLYSKTARKHHPRSCRCRSSQPPKWLPIPVFRLRMIRA